MVLVVGVDVIGTVGLIIIADFVNGIDVNVCFVCDVADVAVADAASII